MNKTSFESLKNAVKECGAFAKEKQAYRNCQFKSDGSIVTDIDIEIAKRLIRTIGEAFSGCNIVNEEIKDLPFNPDAPYTFIFDPIDGTDSFSQGMPLWCIGIGIIDRERQNAGGILYAPSFTRCSQELFVYSSPEDDCVYVNGEKLILDTEVLKNKDTVTQITSGSDIIKQIDTKALVARTDLSSFSLKFKAFGSSLLHMIAPLVFSGVDACLNPTCYVWDVAASYNLVKKAGLNCRYIDGTDFVYNDELLLERRKFAKPLIVGTDNGIKTLIAKFTC